MERYLLFAVVTFSSISSTLTATAIGPAIVHADNPEHCFVVDDNKYYGPGESWQIEGCAIATCTWSNTSTSPDLPQVTLAYESCGVVSTDPPCHVTEDVTLAYPDCCPQVVCPEDEPSVTSGHSESENESTDETRTSSEGIPRSSEEQLKDEASKVTSADGTVEDMMDDLQLFEDNTKETDIFKYRWTDASLNDIESNHIEPRNGGSKEETFDFQSLRRLVSPRFQYRSPHYVL